MKVTKWLAASVVWFSLTALAQSPQSAEQFLRNLYGRYDRSPSGYSSLGKDRNRIFSPSLRQSIRADERRNRGNVGTLDFDPICDCQDDDGLQVKEIHIERIGKDRAKAEVILHFSEPRTKKIVVEMMLLPVGWRVDDVTPSGMPSIRKMLQTATMAKR